MVRYFALAAAVWLFFLPERARPQGSGETREFAVSRINARAVNPPGVLGAELPAFRLPDTTPNGMKVNPALPRYQLGVDKPVNGSLPNAVDPSPGYPEIPDIPVPSWGPGPKMLPDYKNPGNGGGNVFSEDGMIKGINNKVPGLPYKDRISGTIHDVRQGTDNLNGALGPFRILPGKVMADTAFYLMDSARKAGPARKGLLQKEERLGEGFKKVAFSNKPKFWDRTYLEGVVGLDAHTARIRNISPALGYYLHPKTSVGLGPSINLGNPKDTPMSVLGSRSFLKHELFKRKVYLQAENLAHLSKIKDPAREKTDSGKIDHSLYVGAGYLLSVSNVLSLNILMLYEVNQSLRSNQQTGPLGIRLGMSTYKPMK